MRRVALLVAVLAIGACGDNEGDPAKPRSGSRLALTWWQFEDGTRQREVGAYYDRELDIRCSSAEWSDGHHYCAPAADEAVYVNDGCTRALGRTPTSAAPREVFTTRFYLLGRGLPSRVFRRGSTTFAPVGVWEKHDNGCFGPMPAGDSAYYELGDELTDELVRLRRAEPRGAGALAVIDEVGDDGLRAPIAVYDRQRETECTTLGAATSQRLDCVPSDSALASYYRDVECREPQLATTQQPPPAIARQYSAKSRCWRFYAVGDNVVAPPLFEAIGDTCISVAPPAGNYFYVMAGPAQLPVLARVREPTTRRLQRIERVHDDVRVEDDLLFDSELDTECRRDALQRCAPVTDATVLPFFRDPECQLAMELAIVPAGECDPPPRFARKGDTYFPLLAKYIHQIYVPSTGDTCGFYSPPVPFEAWVIGAAVDPTAFATAELQIDP
jgi:hypothetical protein